MSFRRSHIVLLAATLVQGCILTNLHAQTVDITADGFDFPVAPPNGEGYYKSRGFRNKGHLGEDWLVTNGSSAHSLGKPVYSIGNGIAILARDIHASWGNVVIVRHAWIENRHLRFADSLYAHLDRILVRENQLVKRAQQIGTIGNNHGMYPAHLHFEVHKDLSIGVNHQQGTRDLSSYWEPTDFIAAHRKLGGGGHKVPAPEAKFLLPTAKNPWSFHIPRFSKKKMNPASTKLKSLNSKPRSKKSGLQLNSEKHPKLGRN